MSERLIDRVYYSGIEAGDKKNWKGYANSIIILIDLLTRK